VGPVRPLFLKGVIAGDLTVGRIDLLPGQRSEAECHGGDEAIYVLSGTVHIRPLGESGPGWLELSERDGCYLPAGTPHQYYNIGGEPASVAFCHRAGLNYVSCSPFRVPVARLAAARAAVAERHGPEEVFGDR
jgi:uncharacterized RmlC-like cupin family protein